MATLTIGLSGSAVVTGSKNYTISDADVQKILDWAKVAFADTLPQPPAVPTNPQIMMAWVQSWINGTRDAVKVHNTTISTPAPVVFS